MKEVITRYRTTAEGVIDWHPFFCVLPRRVNGKIVWFKTIERRMTKIYWFGVEHGRSVEYRLRDQC